MIDTERPVLTEREFQDMMFDRFDDLYEKFTEFVKPLYQRVTLLEENLLVLNNENKQLKIRFENHAITIKQLKEEIKRLQRKLELRK